MCAILRNSLDFCFFSLLCDTFENRSVMPIDLGALVLNTTFSHMNNISFHSFQYELIKVI